MMTLIMVMVMVMMMTTMRIDEGGYYQIKEEFFDIYFIKSNAKCCYQNGDYCDDDHDAGDENVDKRVNE